MPDRSQQPPTHSFAQVRLDFPTPVILPNGIQLYCVGNGEEEVVRVELHMHGGYYQDPVGKNMLAYLTALISLEGCTGMSPQEISEKFDYCGAWKQAVCQNQYCVLTLSSLCSNLKETLSIFGNCVMHPSFPKKELQLVQNRMASNLATKRQQVRYLAGEKINAIYYGSNHPLGRLVNKEQIMSITCNDLQMFHQNYYRPANCRIVVSGHVGEQELKQIYDIFGQWAGSLEPSPTLSFVPSGARNLLSQIDKPDALQAAVHMRLNAIPRKHDDYIKLRLTVTALGGYFGSRLNNILREQKGYTYGISAALLGSADDSHIGVGTECDNRYVWPVVDDIKQEMEKMKDEPLPSKELDTVKQYMLSDLVKVLDTPFSIANYVSNTWINGTYPEYFNRQVPAIIAATAQDVQEMARKYFNTGCTLTVIAGNVHEIEKAGGKK